MAREWLEQRFSLDLTMSRIKENVRGGGPVSPAERDRGGAPGGGRNVEPAQAPATPPGGPGRLVMLDRDGTINVERHYLSDPAELELLPGAAEGIRSLRQAGLRVAVVTNQSGLARGYFDAATLGRIHARLRLLLEEQGASLDGIFVCPHHPDDACRCRKPGPGLAEQAAAACNAELPRSFVVGDKACDVELGSGVGATTILVRTGYGDGVHREGSVRADYVAGDLAEAAEIIRALVEAERPHHGRPADAVAAWNAP
ncbi:MAG TPA: HAD family hydrolase [Longimicrobium sp.]|jgi:D-glycero-D-manno-heptose 1,7-bisphosphate phosphatase